jgi:NAD(P)-dependent dehydrogenase (short-subunit alcohol dehydrogenase family)
VSDLSPFDLAGKAAIVTGGGGGIGLGVAERFVSAGADVLVADVDAAAADSAAAGLSGARGRAVACPVDVKDPGAGDQLVEACSAAFGTVDILVNSAGVYPSVAFLDLTPADVDHIIGVNLVGTLFVAQAVARSMIAAQRSGVIVNVASTAGLHPQFPGLGAYAASKAGVIQVTKNMALELAEHGIRVVCISPGSVMTEKTITTRARLNLGRQDERPLDDAARAEVIAAATSRIPLGRIGVPDDIGTVALFLASPAASFITGANVVVDGGILLR